MTPCDRLGTTTTNPPTVLEFADRDPEAPLRIPVLDRYYDRGVIVMGKVSSRRARSASALGS